MKRTAKLCQIQVCVPDAQRNEINQKLKLRTEAYCRAKQGDWVAKLKRHKIPDGFQGSIF